MLDPHGQPLHQGFMFVDPRQTLTKVIILLHPSILATMGQATTLDAPQYGSGYHRPTVVWVSLSLTCQPQSVFESLITHTSTVTGKLHGTPTRKYSTTPPRPLCLPNWLYTFWGSLYPSTTFRINHLRPFRSGHTVARGQLTPHPGGIPRNSRGL